VEANASVRFFDEQFQRQIAAQQFELNPFERAALPHLQGRVLDYGCGLGNLAVAAARKGCAVLALDGSAAAIDHLAQWARREGLSIAATQADLQLHEVQEDFDALVCIGLLMFFDCLTAERKLQALLAHVRPGGVAVVNVLIEGTTFMDMFSPQGHCLFKLEDLPRHLAGWQLLSLQRDEFPAAAHTRKVFATAIARRPGLPSPAGGAAPTDAAAPTPHGALRL